jgi:hypothetical protein
MERRPGNPAHELIDRFVSRELVVNVLFAKASRVLTLCGHNPKLSRLVIRT